MDLLSNFSVDLYYDSERSFVETFILRGNIHCLLATFLKKIVIDDFFWNSEILEFFSQIKGVIRNRLAVLKIFIPMQLHEDLEQERTPL